MKFLRAGTWFVPDSLGFGFFCLVTTVLLAHGPILFGKTWFEQDHLIFNLPLRWFLSASLRQGQLPAWWDRVDLGSPFAADPNTGFFYLPAWLVAVLPWDLAADLLQLVHLVWGGLGVMVFSRRLGAVGPGALFAGLVFATSGSTGSLLVQGVTAYSLSWLPWVAVTVHRLAKAQGHVTRSRAAVVAAVTVAAQILSGDPACVLTGAWLTVGIVLVTAPHKWRVLPYLFASYVAAALLASCLLLPLAAVSGESARAGGIPWELGSEWSMHPFRLVEVIWPGILGPSRVEGDLARVLAHAGGIGLSGPNLIVSVTIGLPVMVLALFARETDGNRLRRYWIVVGGFVLLALGAYTPFYRVYRAVFPFERMIRYPERHFLAIAVMLPALAGVGLSRVFGPRSPSRAVLKIAIAGGVVGSLAFLLWIFDADVAAFIQRITAAPASASVQIGVGAAITGGFTTAGLTLLVAVVLSVGRQTPAAPWLVTAAVTLMGVLNHGGLLEKVDRQVLRTPSTTLAPAVAASQAVPFAERFRSRDRALFGVKDKDDRAFFWVEHGRGNIGAIHGLAAYPAFTVLSAPAPQLLWELVAAVNERAILDLLGVRFWVGNANRIPAPDFILWTRNPAGLGLFENLRARPRAFVTSKVKYWSGVPAGASWRDVTDLDSGHIRLVGASSDREMPLTDDGFFEPCVVHSTRPEVVELECDAPADGYAVLLDTPGKGWSASVDEKPAPILIADGLFRAVAVQAGRHTVRFSYQMPGLAAGLLLSSLTLVVLVIAATRLRRTPD